VDNMGAFNALIIAASSFMFKIQILKKEKKQKGAASLEDF